MRFILFCLVFSLAGNQAANAQPSGWGQSPTDYGIHWTHPAKEHSVYIVLLQEVDMVSKTSVNDLGYERPKDALSAALEAAPFQIKSLKVEDYSNAKAPFVTGIVDTNAGEKSFAATLAYRPPNRRMVMRLSGPADLSSLTSSHVSSMQNYPSRYPAADRPGGVANITAPKTTSGKPAQSYAVRPSKPKPAPQTNSGMSSGAASLLAGVRGDLKAMEDKNAQKRAVEKAKADQQKAASQKAEQQRLYQASGAARGYYPAPTAKEEFLAWPVDGAWGVQVPGDTASPRVATRTYSGPSASPSAALADFKRETGLDIKGPQRFEPLEAYKNLDGRNVQILLTETRLNGQPAVAFIFYAQGATNPTGSLRVMEIPAKTYVEWGGVAGMLKLRGVIPSTDVFPAKERRRIARDSLKEQTALYEAILDKFYMENALATMITQAQTTAMMTELNYDLLFGNDITPGPWGD